MKSPEPTTREERCRADSTNISSSVGHGGTDTTSEEQLLQSDQVVLDGLLPNPVLLTNKETEHQRATGDSSLLTHGCARNRVHHMRLSIEHVLPDEGEEEARPSWHYFGLALASAYIPLLLARFEPAGTPTRDVQVYGHGVAGAMVQVFYGWTLAAPAVFSDRRFAF